jgi:glycosyltransferase A (GT-A) superfamily protein (DUF2064 family)
MEQTMENLPIVAVGAAFAIGWFLVGLPQRIAAEMVMQLDEGRYE